MKKNKSFTGLIRTAFAIVAVAVLVSGPASNCVYADPPAAAPAQTNAVPEAPPAPVKHSITGAELYSIHCNRCHAERYPTERTAAQWKTIMLHMQVRANIPVSQSRLILKYLQDNSGR
jgi:cytochrome c5